MNGLTRDGAGGICLAKRNSQARMGTGKVFIFLVQLATSRVCNHTGLIHTLLNALTTIHVIFSLELEPIHASLHYFCFCLYWFLLCCLYSRTYSKSKDKPGKVAIPARGQLNRESEHIPVPVRA